MVRRALLHVRNSPLGKWAHRSGERVYGLCPPKQPSTFAICSPSESGETAESGACEGLEANDSYIALTPLYAFSSDSDELAIAELFKIIKYTEHLSLPLPADDILLRHLRLYEPDYLLWQRAPMDGPYLREMLTPAAFAKEGGMARLDATLSVLFHCPATNLFRLLRLFKPGRITAGDTFVVSCETRSDQLWETTFGKRCSDVL
jgi:hypothetical protein